MNPSSWRSAIACLAFAAAAVCSSGCPPRDVRIVITQNGMFDAVSACTPQGTKKSCDIGHAPPAATIQLNQYLQARLFLLDAAGTVESAGKCVVLPMCPFQMSPIEQGWAACAAPAMNDALDGAMPGGLTFNDLEDPSAGRLILALYLPQKDSGTPRCAHEDLISCNGLDLGVDGVTYDIGCGSCQSGPLRSIGRSTRVCPEPDANSCFLQTCSAWLAGQ